MNCLVSFFPIPFGDLANQQLNGKADSVLDKDMFCA